MKFNLLLQLEGYVNVEIEADSIDVAQDIATSDLTFRLINDEHDIEMDEMYVKKVISINEFNCV